MAGPAGAEDEGHGRVKPPVLAATAHHEAGHAIAAILRAVRFDYVTVEINDNSAGHLRFLVSPRGVERSFHARGIVAMAGEAALRRFNPRSIRRYHGAGDREAVSTYAFENCGGSPAVAAMMVRLWDLQARELIEKWWPQVDQLAAVLLDRQRLSEAECKAVLFPPMRSVHV